MIDKRLAGVLAIAAIVSTILSILLFMKTDQVEIQVLKNHWETPTVGGWWRLPLAEGAVPYTLGVVARKRLGQVSIRFGVLRNQSFTLNYTGLEGLSPREIAARVQDLSFFDSRARGLSESMDVEPMKHEVDVMFAEEPRRVLVIDYYPCVEALVDPRWPMEAPYLFACVFDDSGNLSQFYSGFWDFWQARAVSVKDITIQLNDNVTRYANQQNMAEGCLPLSMTQEMVGRVTFDDLARDDRVFVSFRVNGAAVPGENAFMQIIRLQVDGEYLEPLVNILMR